MKKVIFLVLFLMMFSGVVFALENNTDSDFENSSDIEFSSDGGFDAIASEDIYEGFNFTVFYLQ